MDLDGTKVGAHTLARQRSASKAMLSARATKSSTRSCAPRVGANDGRSISCAADVPWARTRPATARIPTRTTSPSRQCPTPRTRVAVPRPAEPGCNCTAASEHTGTRIARKLTGEIRPATGACRHVAQTVQRNSRHNRLAAAISQARCSHAAAVQPRTAHAALQAPGHARNGEGAR